MGEAGIEPFVIDLAPNLERAGEVRRKAPQKIVIGRLDAGGDDVDRPAYAPAVMRYFLSL
jgi:hypothetical protein